MRITLCARSKILQLLESGKCFRVQAVGSLQAGSHVDLIPDAELQSNDCTISRVPHVVVDLQTATLLANQTIDFDYSTDEFIISNRGKE
jgi:Fe-S cluster assembly iron-binding protein IscA